MINAIINVLQQVAPVTGNDYGLCTKERDESKREHVVQYVGGGQGKRVEGESFSYWRVTGPIKQSIADDLTGCRGAAIYSIPLRYVMCGERSVCGPNQLNIAAKAMRGTGKSIERSVRASIVEMRSASIETDPARARQEIVDTPVPLHLAIGYIDLTVEVTGDSCLLDCSAIDQSVPTY